MQHALSIGRQAMTRAALAAFVVLALAACSKPEPWKQESYVFGTRVELTVYAANLTVAEQAAASVLADLDRLHRQLHPWQAGSDVVAANQAIAAGKPFTPSVEVATLVREAQQLEARSGGLFSPAIGAMVAWWGFQQDNPADRQRPASELTRLVEARPRMADLAWQGSQLYSANRQVKLDFGGMAKGWVLDRAYRQLQVAGASAALVNIGGNIIALGEKPDGEPWQVGIRHPRQSLAMAVLPLHDGEAIGTSGDYQRYFEVAGKRHCHLIDPRDGNSDCRVQSLSVLVPKGAQAGLLSDVASKPMYFADAANLPVLARQFGVAGWLRIDAKGHAMLNPVMAKRLEWRLKPDSIQETP